MTRANFNDNWRVSLKLGQFGRAVATEEKTVTLPYDAMINTRRNPNAAGSNKKGFYENGTWEYKKTFFIPDEQQNKKTIIEFEGVYQRAMVYINGDFAGQQPYGYSQFTVDADRFIKYGADNEITVVVRTADDARWYTGAGIYRDVHMLTSSLIFIKPCGVKITTPDISAERAVVNTMITLHNDSAKPKETTTVAVELRCAEGELVASGTAPCTVFRGETAVQRLRLYIKNPKLWSADSPNLYTCTTRLTDRDGSLLDESSDRFGVRSLSLDYDNGLRINGETVKLRGACIHHDNGPLGAASMYDAEKRRISILKEAGFNAIRMSHNTAGRALLDACDEAGMLVMDEAFDMWTTSKSDFDYALDFPVWWEKDIRAMVDKDFNHPSVIMYSIGNEIQDTGSPNGSAWGRKLAEKVRELDPSRYVTNGINGMVSVMELLIGMQKANKAKMESQDGKDGSKNGNKNGNEINNMMTGLGAMMKQIMCMEAITKATEESFACLDIAGYNYMDSRYITDRELFPGRIIVGSETFPPDIDQNWRMVLDNGNILGDFTWTGWDYLGEAGVGKVHYPSGGKIENIYGVFPSLVSMTADIAITGCRRPVSYYREIVFGLRTVPYISVQKPERYNDTPVLTPWSWSDSVSHWSWTGYENKPVKVEVYSQAEEVELFVNGKSIGCRPAGEVNRFKTVFDTVYEPGEIIAVAYDNKVETGRFCLRTAKGPVKLSAEADKTHVRCDTSSLVYVSLSLTDSDGNIFAADNRKVRVQTEGAGQLAGFANADPETEENFYDTGRTTYNGRALAVIRPAEAGEITVTITADGIEPQRLIIISE